MQSNALPHIYKKNIKQNRENNYLLSQLLTHVYKGGRGALISVATDPFYNPGLLTEVIREVTFSINRTNWQYSNVENPFSALVVRC